MMVLFVADTVIMHDLDFNPENDKQAEDRCHRIGQVKPVNIIKLVAKDTVDEDIYQMGERKSMLSKAVLDGTGGQMSRDKEEGEGDVVSGCLCYVCKSIMSYVVTMCSVLVVTGCYRSHSSKSIYAARWTR